MRGVADRNLVWDEPRRYRRAVDFAGFRSDHRESLKFAGSAFLILSGLRWLAGFRPRPDYNPPAWPIFLPIAAIIALAIAFVLPPLMMLLGSAVVVISDVGINHNVMWGRGWRHNFHPWDEIGRCELGQKAVDGQTYTTLTVLDREGRELRTVAVSPKVSRAELEREFSRRGRRLEVR